MQTLHARRAAPSWPILCLLALVPLLANWPAVCGWLTVDPIYTLSGLGTGLIAGPLSGTTVLDPNVGITTQALGRLAATEWFAGRIPWWNPYDGIGLPLSAEGQNQALFFPFVLLLAFRNGPLLLLLALQEVAAFSTYALLRQMRLTRVASFIGAAVFAINGTFAWLGHGPMMPVAFAPMLLLGVEMEWASLSYPPPRESSYGFMVAAIAVAFSLYAGFPQTAYLDGLLGAAWALLRVAQCTRADRIRFVLRLCAGAATGLLLAAPFLVPFAHMLSVANLGIHANDIGTIAAPTAALPVLVMPYVLGPQTFGSSDPTGLLVWLWDFLGGYVSLPLAFLALLALISGRGRPSLGLRCVLAGWCVLMVGASFGVPGIDALVYGFPGLRQTQVFRYSPPSWELAVTVLAAIAIDDWRRIGVQRGRVLIAATFSFTAAAVALSLATKSIRYLDANVPNYDRWVIVSVGVTVASTLLSAILLMIKAGRSQVAVLATLLLTESLALFSIPRLSGLRRATLDTTAVTFLKDHLGLQRIYAFGAFAPNYPAYFKLASINSDYLPTPRIWTDYISNALDPLSERNAFTGAFQWPTSPRPDHFAEFRARFSAYRDLAVRYILVPTGESLSPVLQLPTYGQLGQAFELAAGANLKVAVPGDLITPGMVDTVSVTIGTYKGASNGALAVEACAGRVCEGGFSDLASAGDNVPLAIRLNAPLALLKGEEVDLRFSHQGGTASVAIWRYPQLPSSALLPGLSFGFQTKALPLRSVFANSLMTIYELLDSAPYFEATGDSCRISPIDRETVITDCSAPARLTRRELFFDGWRATIDGHPAPVALEQPIMQAIDLPPGRARIKFHYAPPYATESAVAFFLGLAFLALGLVKERYSAALIGAERRRPSQSAACTLTPLGQRE